MGAMTTAKKKLLWVETSWFNSKKSFRINLIRLLAAKNFLNGFEETTPPIFFFVAKNMKVIGRNGDSMAAVGSVQGLDVKVKHSELQVYICHAANPSLSFVNFFAEWRNSASLLIHRIHTIYYSKSVLSHIILTILWNNLEIQPKRLVKQCTARNPEVPSSIPSRLTISSG